MKRIEKLTDGPIGAGTRYAAEFVKGPPMVMECTRCERPVTWSLTGDSPALKASGDWRVLPTADGSHLVVRVEMQPHGLLRLAAGVMARMHRRPAAAMATHTTPPPWSPRRRRPRADPAQPARGGNDMALTLIKAAHTLAWFSIESCMAYVLYAGAARRTDRHAVLAGAVVAGECLVFAASGFRCPLTQLAEKIGAADGSVTDIWLPRWFAHNLPAIHVPLLAAAVYLNARNLRGRQPPPLGTLH